MAKRYKNIIVIPPQQTFGDAFSSIGLIYFLLKYYDNVYFYLGDKCVSSGATSDDFHKYFRSFFGVCEHFDKRIHLLSDSTKLFDSITNKNDLHICNQASVNWNESRYDLNDTNKIDPKYYFNDSNPINNSIKIPKEYVSSPNLHYPNNIKEINHLFYYKLIGLNNTVRMDFFDYKRNIKKELDVKREILKKFGIGENEKYNITNNIRRQSNLQEYIKNDYKCIDMCNLVDFPGWLLTLVEGAEEIHLIEGCNVNFIYHCQYKKIMDDSKKVFFHIWCYDRHWLKTNVMMDHAWKMMDTPKLDNWEFIFKEPGKK